MDEKSRSLVIMITDERIKPDTLLRCPHSMFPCASIAAHRSHLCFPALLSRLFQRKVATASRGPKLTVASNQFTMAKAKSLPIFLVAVLVTASCIAVAHGAITGTILSRTLLQVAPGSGTAVLTTLTPSTVVSVICRRQSDIVFDDPWWLTVSVPSTGMTGWVTDYYVDCGNVGNCNVPQC